jgi:hypothetical protein
MRKIVLPQQVFAMLAFHPWEVRPVEECPKI